MTSQFQEHRKQSTCPSENMLTTINHHHQCIILFTHPPTRSFTHTTTHFYTHPSSHSPTPLLTHPPFFSPTHPPSYPPTPFSPTHPPTHLSFTHHPYFHPPSLTQMSKDLQACELKAQCSGNEYALQAARFNASQQQYFSSDLPEYLAVSCCCWSCFVLLLELLCVVGAVCCCWCCCCWC